ncbi:MAG: hypothetical protein AB8G22_08115 [Saprospiraceae bacterium]
MNTSNWQRLGSVNDYLEAKKESGVAAFISLLQRAKRESADLVVLSFTYENVEAYAKIDGQFQLFDDLFVTLSQSEMDELTRHDYDETNEFADFRYWKFQELVWELIEIWIVDCFEQAASKVEVGEMLYYFKHNHDSLEALELNSCSKKLEKAEFATYVKNSQYNMIELLGSN